MLVQVRATVKIVAQQHALAEQLVAAALARYTSNTGKQSRRLRTQARVRLWHHDHARDLGRRERDPFAARRAA